MTAVRAVGVVGRVWFRFGRNSFQGAFFFDFFRFFPFSSFALFPCFPFLRFPPFPCFPVFLRFPPFFSLLPFLRALASFLPGFPFGFLDARRRDRGFRLRTAPASADRCGNSHAQRHEERPLGANLLKLRRHVTVQVANAQDTAAPGSQGSRSARRPRTSRTSWPCLAAVPR